MTANDNVPESERWLPVRTGALERFREALAEARAVLGDKDFCAKSAKNSPALDRARREAEAVIADRLKRTS